MANMPNIEKALNENVDSVVERLANKMLYDATSRAVRTALALSQRTEKVGSIDLYNEHLAIEESRAADRAAFEAMGLTLEPDAEDRPFLQETDGKAMVDLRRFIWESVAKKGIKVYNPVFEQIMNNRMNFFMSEPTPDNILAERRKLVEEGRSQAEVSSLSDDHFKRIIREMRKRLAEYDQRGREKASALFLKWLGDAEPTVDVSRKVVQQMDLQARNRAYNDCLKTGMYGYGTKRQNANRDKILMESLYADCADDYLPANP